MSEISDFADSQIFPLVYERADQIFPEFNFQKKGNHWVSGNDLKIDGSKGKKHKVYIYSDNPHYLKDFTRGGKAITTYLIENGQCSSWIEAIQYLAREVGVQLPERNLSEEDIERINKRERQVTLFETINDFFTTSLLEEKESDADALRSYLGKRGYSDYLPKSHDDIHTSNKMELGFIPSREKLKKYLKAKEIDPKEADTLFHPGIGTTHKLAIPFRAHGRIVGFAFRNINHVEGSHAKYLYSTELNKESVLFGFKRPKNSDSELIIVEGLLDAINAKARGMDNVVALGGTSFNARQAELISKYGYKTVTLCLDNDKSGREATQRAIDEIIKSELKVYIAKLPNDFNDPDEFIRSQGLDAFVSVSKGAKAWYSYLLRQHFERYNELGEIPDKDRDEFFKEAISISNKIKDPFDLEFYTKELETLGKPFGISKETIDSEIILKREKERQSAELKKALDKAQALLAEGREPEAIRLLGNISKQINTTLPSYQQLLVPATEDSLRESLKNKPDHLCSGFKINKEDLLIPSGALTIIAASTSHGKTSFLINTGLNVATNITTIQSNKSVYLFSFEESKEAIILKALNTYIDKDLSKNNRRSIESCIKENTDQYISQEYRALFSQQKKRFFSELIETGSFNIIYSDFTSDDLIGAIHYLRKDSNVGLILVDYIQLLRLKANRYSSRQEELKQICLDLKNCAVETGLPIVLGAQFNRTVTERAAIHPTAIGEAGDIERVANVIVGLWNNQFPDLGDKNHTPRPFISAKILKGRNIVPGTEEDFHFNGNTGKISNRVAVQNEFAAKRSTVTPLSPKDYSEASDGS